MPLYHYSCPGCLSKSRKILTPAESKAPQTCKECSGVLAREMSPPSSQTTEIIDTGFMPKRLERLADAERLFKERNEIAKKNRDSL